MIKPHKWHMLQRFLAAEKRMKSASTDSGQSNVQRTFYICRRKIGEPQKCNAK
jgi:hypothetical protein